jgi:quinol monooxygenase YgiN
VTGIRVLHQLIVDRSHDDELATYAHLQRQTQGCEEAECYRSVSTPERVGIVELWEDQYSFADHWCDVLDDPAQNLVLRHTRDLPAGQSATEFYRHQYFDSDGVWIASPHRARRQKIFWPGTGAVRVVIQLSQENSEASLAARRENIRETRREPGCLDFDLYRSIEFPDDILLIELWRDQTAYDAHWNLRLKSSTGGGGVPAQRRQGTNGFEFYRQQAFLHLYDRWVPAAEGTRSETVLWAD